MGSKLIDLQYWCDQNLLVVSSIIHWRKFLEPATNTNIRTHGYSFGIRSLGIYLGGVWQCSPTKRVLQNIQNIKGSENVHCCIDWRLDNWEKVKLKTPGLWKLVLLGPRDLPHKIYQPHPILASVAVMVGCPPSVPLIPTQWIRRQWIIPPPHGIGRKGVQYTVERWPHISLPGSSLAKYSGCQEVNIYLLKRWTEVR